VLLQDFTMRVYRATAALTATALVFGFSAAAREVDETFQTSGVQGGLVVHLGCGNGELTAKLRKSDAYVVHGLDTDLSRVQEARARFLAGKFGGTVSAATFDGKHLPYIDNMVNLIVIQDTRHEIRDEELKRVLAPRGAIIAPEGTRIPHPVSHIGNGFVKFTRPVPSDIDQWTHYLHGPDNNAVANDKVVGPPRRLQWQAGPKWTRHHDKMSTFSAMVSARGRVFYIIDEGSMASIMFPPHWALVARDAFNGKILWKRKIGPWFSNFKGLKDGPADAPRRLVASGDTVYATLSLAGPLTALDAATGKTLRTYHGSDQTEEVILSDGVLFVLTGPGSIGDGRRSERPAEKRTIQAIKADTGEKLWEHSDVVAATTPAVDARSLYYFNFDSKSLVCLDRKSGNRLWDSEPLPTPDAQKSFFASKLVVADGVVLLASGESSGMIKSGGGATRDDTLTAVDAETGRQLWQGKHPPSGYSSPENIFVIDGIVWCDNSSNGRSDGRVIGYDLATGEVKCQFPADESSYWFHHRCYAGRATTNFILTSRTGIEFIDLKERHWDLNHWVRGACLYGIMPCNGLLYTPPAPCICYAETYLHNFNAFRPSGDSKLPLVVDRLVKGPAYGRHASSRLQPAASSLQPLPDWPTYRGSNSRNGYTKAAVPAELSPAWEAELGGRLSSITAAGGTLFVAAVDRHTVYAIDASSGKELWHYTVGGRVDSPPTLFEGLVLFGSADGYVYCLNAADGQLAWRFLAARADRRIISFEQIESLWPVHGSILVRDGIAHFVAGRSIFVDGGMKLYRLDARTGKSISETILDEKNPATGKNAHELIQWLNMPVGRPDILSCDEQRIYMRSQAFDFDGKRLRMGPRGKGSGEGKFQGGEDTHLFCPTGFLDDTWFHRTYWLYGSTWGSGWCGYYVAGQHAPAGKLICVGDDRVFVFGRQPQYYKWTTPLEYRLFASKKIWQPGSKPPAKTTRKSKRGGSAPVSNKENYFWVTDVPVLVRAMTLANRTLFIAGPKDVLDEGRAGQEYGDSVLRQEAAYAAKIGGVLWAVSADDGATVAQYELDSPPIFDGMIAAGGRLFLSTMDGRVVCLARGEQ